MAVKKVKSHFFPNLCMNFFNQKWGYRYFAVTALILVFIILQSDFWIFFIVSQLYINFFHPNLSFSELQYCRSPSTIWPELEVAFKVYPPEAVYLDATGAPAVDICCLSGDVLFFLIQQKCPGFPITYFVKYNEY